jgi:uncharacterized protein (DUF1810 family)
VQNAVMDHALERFVIAQQPPAYDRVLGELRLGRKTGHWIWFIFPQIAGLGSSETSRYYAITSMGEARAYLAHPVLGPRLRECARVVASTEGRTAEQMFGPVDAMKVRSCMTLFLHAAPEEGAFRRVLDRFFGGVADPATERLLARQAGEPSPGGLSPG